MTTQSQVQVSTAAKQGFAYRVEYKDSRYDDVQTMTVVTERMQVEEARYMVYDLCGDAEVDIISTTLVARVAVKQYQDLEAIGYRHTQQEDNAHDPIFDSFGKHIHPNDGYYTMGALIIHDDSVEDFMLETMQASYKRAKSERSKALEWACTGGQKANG